LGIQDSANALIDRVDMNFLSRAFGLAACISIAIWILRLVLADAPDAVHFSVAKNSELYRARVIAAGELLAVAILSGLYLALRRYKAVRRFR